MSSTNPFFIVGDEAGGVETVPWLLVTASRHSAETLTPRLHNPAAVIEEFRNSRRDGERMLGYLSRLRPTQRNFLRSILGSHTSLDFKVCCQLTSCPL